jgi:two-component system LytT family sensor kinase
MIDWIQQQNFYSAGLSILDHWVNLSLIFSMFQHVAIIFVIAFLFSKSKAFELLIKNTMRKRDWLVLYVIFFFISFMGSVIADQVTIYSATNQWTDAVIFKTEIAILASEQIDHPHYASIQIDARSIGAVLAGLLGGPLLGGAVGISSGIARFFMGGDAALGGAIGTSLAGLLAGLVYLLVLKNKPSLRFDWKIAFLTTSLVELIMKGMVVLTAPELDKGLALIQITALPNTLGNSIGAALFVTILNDYDKNAASFSSNALRMAGFFAKILKRDLTPLRKADLIARFIQRETGIAAVAITSQTKLVAFSGMGSDHHTIGDTIAAGLVKKAIDKKQVIFVDGYNNHFLCKKANQCPLRSALIAPIIINNEVEDTLLLFESKQHFFPKMNRELGKELASLLSEQIQAARYPKLLAQAEDQYLRGKVDPHFLANALTTISAIISKDKSKAKALLRKLASLMRERINPDDEGNTLAKELSFLKNYIDIEKERFGDRLQITIEQDTSLLNMIVPRFVLQMIVENSIKHGVNHLLDTGYINVKAYRTDNGLVKIDIKDNAGLFCEKKMNQANGHGMQLANDLIKAQFNSNAYGISWVCEPYEYTVISLTLPFEQAG